MNLPKQSTTKYHCTKKIKNKKNNQETVNQMHSNPDENEDYGLCQLNAEKKTTICHCNLLRFSSI